MNNLIPRYASYTYNHPNFLVRFPHRKRNKLVAEKIAETCSARWLDYGAGDGALLDVLLSRKQLPDVCVLYEPEPSMRLQLSDKVSELGLSKSVKVINSTSEACIKFDLVTVLEVLEHLPMPERIKFYRFVANHLELNGKVLIEVQIEYGPILLLKEWGRRFLKKRVSEYKFRELFNAAFLLKILDAHSRYAKNDERTFISPHRGFDLDKLIDELRSFGTLQEIVRSPFPLLPRICNQVVLFSFDIKERDVNKIEDAVIKVSGKR